jgi:hypothetical protein
VYEELSVPETVTLVALVAVTVSLDAAPAVTLAGLALMLTVGVAEEAIEVVLVLPDKELPHPVNASRSAAADTLLRSGAIRQRDLRKDAGIERPFPLHRIGGVIHLDVAGSDAGHGFFGCTQNCSIRRSSGESACYPVPFWNV